MDHPLHVAPCIAHRMIARDVYEFTLQKPAGFTFVPGQFILFQVPLPSHPDDIQPRAFSLASAPHEADLRFVATLKPGGRASAWIEQYVRPGVAVAFTRAMGNFSLQENPGRTIVFLATSSGVAPFRAMIEHTLANGDVRPMHLIFGVRSEEDLFWSDEFYAIQRRHPHVRFHQALTKPSSSWRGSVGRVQTIFPQLSLDPTVIDLYACGNPAMTKEVKALAISAWGIGAKNVHVEGYI